MVHGGWKQRVLYTNPELLNNLQADYRDHESAESAKKFTSIVSNIRVGGTYKLTGWDRLAETNAMIARNCSDFKQIKLLDVGASDGVVTAQLVDFLVDDLDVKVNALMFDLYTRLLRFGPAWFSEYRAEGNAPLLFRFGPFIAKIDKHQSNSRMRDILVNLYHVCRGVLTAWLPKSQTISLVNPLVQTDPQIKFETQSVLEKREDWVGKFNLVRASNILNRAYFSEDQLRTAIENLFSYLETGGLLVISRNHEESPGAPDHGSVWKKMDQNSLDLIDNNRDGSYIRELVAGNFGRNTYAEK